MPIFFQQLQFSGLSLTVSILLLTVSILLTTLFLPTIAVAQTTNF